MGAKVKVRELSKPEAETALKRTGLDIVLAGEPMEGNYRFFAAHNDAESYAVLDSEGEITVWQLTGGTKQGRKARTEQVRRDFGGKQ